MKLFTLLFVAVLALSASAQDDFTIEVDDITWRDAHVVVTPKDPNMKYFMSSLTIEKLNSDPTMQGDVQKIPDFDMAWWDLAGSSKQEVIQRDLVSGVLDKRTLGEGNNGMFHWNSQGVIYCYGMNEQCEMITPIYYKIINTLGPTQVDMTFDVNIEEMLQTSVKATITPSSNDPYFVSIERPAFLGAFDNDADMQYKLLQSYGDEYIFTGQLRTRESVFPLKSKDQDYNFVIFGFNNGPTTPITIVPFRTLKSGQSSLYKFEYYFLNDEGTDVDENYLAPVEGEKGTYTYLVEDGDEVADTWKGLTGYPVSPNDNYSYKYQDTKYEVLYEINASKKATNGYYGEMSVDVYDYPFIKKILFVDESYFDTTDIVTARTEKPIIRDIYSLDGRRITKAQKGIYIQNGKKYVK